MNNRIVSLGDICRPKQWKTLSKKDLLEDGFTVYGANGPIGYTDKFTHEHDTILVGCRGSCGSLHIMPGRSYANGNAMALGGLKEDRVDLQFLYRFLEARGFDDVITGTSQPQIIRSNIERIEIPLPPLDEQKRLAAILDQADALRRLRARAIDKLNTLGQAIFKDMFGDPFDTRHSNKMVALEDLTERITYGFTSPMSHHADGIPIITGKNVRDGYIDYSTCKYADQSEFDQLTAKSKPQVGDLLITKDGTIGRYSVFSDNFPICINQSVALVRPNHSKVVSEYLAAYIGSTGVQARFQNMKKGNALPHLQITELAKFPILSPTPDEQRQLKHHLARIDKQRRLFEASIRHQEALFSSLQYRAFRGDL